ncbi:methyltransferase domain-containing protein [Candidatus Woesearchaeota archaeon]|nr:methyltransferase domain-containing protein [Candidatus Woesearchaeota archaeon]
MTEIGKKWLPDKAVSEGAAGYHNAVINASWNNDNLYELVSLMKPEVNENDTIVDFGAGTGASSLCILNHIKLKFNLWLVDNSPAWLAKAYEILRNNQNVSYFILEKKDNSYLTLDRIIGNNAANMVVSANTFHLVPNLKDVFEGIAKSLKKKGMFIFQSGNIIREGRVNGMLMIEDTIHKVHDIAIDIIKNESLFKIYRENINERIKAEEEQRKLIFPFPRHIDIYLNALKHAGFLHEPITYKTIRVKYDDWMKFLRVKRLQAGILPEIGSRYPSEKEEHDRDKIITMAANRLFDELKNNNPFADKE